MKFHLLSVFVWFQGYFFHDHGSVQDSDRDELLSEAPSLSDTIDPPYRKIHTTWTAGLEIVVIVRPSSAHTQRMIKSYFYK